MSLLENKMSKKKKDFKRMETDKDKIRIIESVTNGTNTTKNISQQLFRKSLHVKKPFLKIR